jgi:ubiquinone/menaquinone biosynthesis C-methylase UbiE
VAKNPKVLRLGEFLLAVEGLALARNVFQGSEALADERIAGIRQTVEAMTFNDDSVENQRVLTEELSLLQGYELWSASYDDVSNPLVDVEEPALFEVLQSFPPGKATDIGCGTGRVSIMLHNLGHSVTGIDQSSAMLELAQRKAPAVTFLEHSFGSGHSNFQSDQDLISCSFTLAHFPDLTTPLGEIANMLRPGGCAVLTDIHPLFAALDGQAFFNAEDGRTPWVRNYVHQFSDYLRAFAAAGLGVVACEEVVPADGQGPMQGLAGLLRPDATRQAYLGLPTVLLWVVQKPVTSS